ncbi:MAG TPA: FAD-dependent monooxygenase [Xanthobacteraceae bacterium]|jgi:salicylate hydroxylase/6-hydroxynicotinate 3-monooxygenase|nr:FAD-dependent monooxygenase [Xanthobacteraceae bacterium]
MNIAVIGAGMGGLAAAATLRRVGIDVTVYEQAAKFTRLGAGIQQGPNAVKVHRRLGLEERLRAVSFRPRLTFYKDSATGALMWEKMQGDYFEDRYGAPHLLLHRADLHEALASIVPDEVIKRGKKLAGITQDPDGVDLAFADGTTARADAVIGADGVHSIVREWMLGVDKPRFTGRVAYRTTFPAKLLNGLQIDECTKWMAADRHIVIYYINPQHSEVYFVTSTPEPDFNVESWSSKGDIDELRALYRDFHPQVRAVLAACPEAHKWALVERDPLPRWTQGRVALLGDACHPMTPYLAQGAGTAIEDAAVLSRCLQGVGIDGIADALKVYEINRLPRTARIQTMSSTNDINQFRDAQDFVNGYDAWDVPLEQAMALAAR